MDRPDQRLFEEDIRLATFRMGGADGRWGLAPPDLVPAEIVWPKQILWMAAARRTNGPDRFYVLLDLTGYRTLAPTGAFWDPNTRTALPTARWPKGKEGSRFAKVFRTDWQQAVAFYHPFDRFAAQTHSEWAHQQPHLIWTAERTIVDYLTEFHALLQGGDYLGV